LSKRRDKGLSQYRKKRDPSKTTEPFEAEPARRSGFTRRGRFVVHCHDAKRLHYDLRIQVGSVLESFAVPKGPSMRIDDRRLAVRTEAHPLRYLDFEGVIPEGSYGAGAMIVWDRGRVSYSKDPAEVGLQKGALSLNLDGFKLKGRFSLVRPSKRGGDQPQEEWLLIKRDDAYALDEDITQTKPRSVLSGMTVAELTVADGIYEEAMAHAASLGAKRGSFVASQLTPMLCSMQDASADRAGWIFELKLDGVRILAERKGREARLFYRTHRSATASFPEVVEALKSLLAKDVILDGEIITLDETGLPSFQKLASRIHAHRPSDVRFLRDAVPVVFVVFDVLKLGGLDLRKLPLRSRKALLKRILPGEVGVIRPLDYVQDDGRPILAFCEQHGLEGIVAKRADSQYRVGPRRTGDWIKIKRFRDDDFIVTGYTAGKGSRARLGALELATFRDGQLQACGRVGSGLSEAEIDRLLPRLEAKELVVVRVQYAGWTEDGNLRHPVYLGIRTDVTPEDVTLSPKPEDATLLEGASDRRVERTVGKAVLTNQQKVFWPEDGITKGDLCDYYEAIAPALLPHLHDRPVTLVRYPDGIEGKSFHQWRIPDTAPPWLQSLRLRASERDGKEVSTILINDLSSLMYVANLGCIPLHVIASRAGSLGICDFLTLDLDVELASLKTAIPIALTIRDVLGEIGLRGFPKTSGKSGLHVLVPLGRGLPFDAAKHLLELIARLTLQRHPKDATMQRRKNERGSRVLIDVGQTGRLRTIVAPYSVRAVPGAKVSTPLFWEEVSLALDPSSFHVFTVPERVLAVGDPMADAYETELDLETTMERLGKLVGSDPGP
jgi:bifunctional non-homologous end joining protein LigD